MNARRGGEVVVSRAEANELDVLRTKVQENIVPDTFESDTRRHAGVSFIRYQTTASSIADDAMLLATYLQQNKKDSAQHFGIKKLVDNALYESYKITGPVQSRELQYSRLPLTVTFFKPTAAGEYGWVQIYSGMFSTVDFSRYAAFLQPKSSSSRPL